MFWFGAGLGFVVGAVVASAYYFFNPDVLFEWRGSVSKDLRD